jgi:thiamine monophosphate kinase
MQLAVSGGEDYELLAILPLGSLDDATARMEAAGETNLTAIGEIREGEGVEIRLPGGGLLEAAGYDHFAPPSRETPSAARERRDG